jgi:predicted lipoprotein
MVKTAGNGLSWAVLGGLLVTVAATKTGCAPIPQDKGGDWLESVMVRDVLAGIGPEVVLPTLARFTAELDALDASLAEWERASEGTAPGAPVAVQTSWRAAMMVWQELELMQVGPAGSSLTTIAGEDLRDEVYSWPTVNPCRVDQEVVGGGWVEPSWFSANLVNSYGLDAVEHIVFSGEDNACPAQVDINTDGSWSALGPDGVAAQRVGFARALTAHLIEQAEALQTAWSPEGDNFSGALALSTPDSPYADEQEALNAVFRAAFYLETVTKDRKLGQPLGVLDCTTGTCPDDAEHLGSRASMEAIAANLRGFRRLFTGGEGVGLDDLLADLGHESLAMDILADTDAALALAEASSVSISEGVESDPASVEVVFEAVKTVTDRLKGDLVTVLALEIPSEAAGDND